MFMSEYSHSIDAKGRVIVPAKFREELGETFVVTQGLDGCLFVFPNEEWKNFEEFLRWCKATYEPGTSLHRIDEVKPYCPTNCEWKPMTNSVQYRKHLADTWDRIMVPIRQRYEKQIREVQGKKAQQYFRYEHPDLVREGIAFGYLPQT